MTASIWLCRVYSLLLRAYPPEFRERYADEMARVFGDRAREIAQSGGRWRLLGYTLSTGRDWFVTVLRERMDSMQMPSLSTLRWVFLFCVVLDLVLLTRRAMPATYSAPLPFALLIMYGLLVFLVTTNLDEGRRIALQTGTFLGLLSGAVLTTWTMGSPFLPFTGISAQFMGFTSFAIILTCWSVAGYRAARRTATASLGWLAGCWGAIVCVLVKVTCALMALSMSLPGQDLVRVLVPAGQHLVEGPVIGALLGGLAGFVARILGRGKLSSAELGLAGGK